MSLLLAQLVYFLWVQFGGEATRKFDRVPLEESRFVDVSFENHAEGISLAGMLFVPRGEGPHDAAVIVHGSGDSHRRNGWYLALVHYLQDHGILVLLPDKRGSEKSQGDWRTSSFERLATDTVAAVDYLLARDDLAIGRMGIVGLSQGGHIAPLIASLSGRIEYVVNVVGGAIPKHELLVYEERHNLEEFGVMPGLSHVLEIGRAHV